MSVASQPQGLSVSADGSKVYVANVGNNSVSVISSATNSVINTIMIGNNPTSLGNFIANVPTACAVAPSITSASPTSVGVGGTITIGGVAVAAGTYTIVNDNTITVIVPAGASSGSILVTTPGGVSNAGSVTISAGSGNVYAYITNVTDNTVSVLNTNTYLVSPLISIGQGSGAVSVSHDNKVYFSNANSNTVSVLDAKVNAITATINVGSNPFGIAVSPDDSKVYVANLDGNTVTVINAVTHSVITNVTVGANPYGVAVSPDGSLVYVTNEGSGSVSVISTATNTVTATISVGSYPRGVAFSPNGTYAYVANLNSNNVSIIDVAGNYVVANRHVGNNPTGICVGSNETVYVTNTLDNTITIFNPLGVIATVAVGTSPFGISITPDGNSVYVVNQFSNNVSIINTTTNTVVSTIAVGNAPYSFGNFITTVTSSSTPTISTTSPSTTAIGGTISITGTGFTGATGITIGGVSVAAGSYTVVNDNTITVTVPAGATSGSVTVTTAAGTSNAGSVTITVLPVISSVTTTSSSAGGMVTITGTGFNSATSVTIGGVLLSLGSFTIVNDHTITTTIPANAISGNVSIATAAGSSNTVTYTVTIAIVAGIGTDISTTNCTDEVIIHNITTGLVSGTTYNYTLYFGDGPSVNTSSAADLKHTYLFPGTYTILLQVLDANNQFITSTTKTVTTNGTAPTVQSVVAIYGPTYSSGTGTVILNGGNSTITSGNLSFYWTVTGGGATTQYNTPSLILPIAQTSSDVVYTAQLTVKDATGGCATDPGAAQNFTINKTGASAAAITAGIGTDISTTNCTDEVTIHNTTTGQVIGATYNYTWYFGDGGSVTTSSTADINHTYIYPSIYTITLNVTDANGQLLATTTHSLTTTGTAPTVEAIAQLYGPYNSPTASTATLNGGNSTLSYGNSLNYEWVVTIDGAVPATYNTASLPLTINRTGADQLVSAVLTVSYGSGCVHQTADAVTFTVPALVTSIVKTGNNSIHPNKILVYPNPAISAVNLTVGLEKITEKVTVKVYNSLGQQVAIHQLSTGKMNILESTIPVSQLKEGLYFVRAFNAEGELIGNTTLLKH